MALGLSHLDTAPCHNSHAPSNARRAPVPQPPRCSALNSAPLPKPCSLDLAHAPQDNGRFCSSLLDHEASAHQEPAYHTTTPTPDVPEPLALDATAAPSVAGSPHRTGSHPSYRAALLSPVPKTQPAPLTLSPQGAAPLSTHSPLASSKRHKLSLPKALPCLQPPCRDLQGVSSLHELSPTLTLQQHLQEDPHLTSSRHHSQATHGFAAI